MGRRSQSALLTAAIMVAVAVLVSHADLVRRMAKEYAAFIREQAALALEGGPPPSGSPVPPRKALDMLKQGNQRYVSENFSHRSHSLSLRALRATIARAGENPMAVVIGCADSHAPVERIFDAKPGDLYVVRNAGNTCSQPDSSLLASTEYAVASLEAKLIVVLGHTECGAMLEATKRMVANLGAGKSAPEGDLSTLDLYLEGFAGAGKQALEEMCEEGLVDDIAAVATRLNVFKTIEKLVEFSDPIRQHVAMGEVEIHGAIYQTSTGKVEWLGQHPRIFELATTSLGHPTS